MKGIFVFGIVLLLATGNFGIVFNEEKILEKKPIIKNGYSPKPVLARANTTIDSATLHWLGENINFDDIAWHPSGSYGIIVGHGGMVIKYDGLRFTVLARNLGFDPYDVKWKPDGTYALIVGTGG
ncbi:MAG: hypothetical protein AB1779_08145, partial [Candidatus Thermoplasmatota archaeon]